MDLFASHSVRVSFYAAQSRGINRERALSRQTCFGNRFLIGPGLKENAASEFNHE